VGELHLDAEEKAEIKENPLSKIVFYDEDEELYNLTRIFLQIPFEYSGMGQLIGKRYDAVKDFLEWNNFNKKKWTAVVFAMGQEWVFNIKQ